jgi:predicted amidophosphoribosyltransferase
LNCPISKHKLRIHQGLSAPQFEARYADALVVDAKAKDLRQALLIDDVCTEGGTLKCAIAALRGTNPEMAIAVATAGQMIVKAVVDDAVALLQAEPRSGV